MTNYRVSGNQVSEYYLNARAEKINFGAFVSSYEDKVMKTRFSTNYELTEYSRSFTFFHILLI